MPKAIVLNVEKYESLIDLFTSFMSKFHFEIII